MKIKIEHELVFNDIEPSTINRSFDKAVVRIACLGENANGSFFKESSFEKALPSLKNIPIVALYKEDEDNFGGHETGYEIKDGELKVVYNTHPFGVIHESAKQWYELVEENGVQKKYLVSECLLWKRQKSYELVKEKGKFSVSMEIQVLSGEYDKQSNVYQIDDFIFTAIAVLGEGVRPCFQSAELKLFSNNEEYNEMLQAYRQFGLEMFKGGEKMENEVKVVGSVVEEEVATEEVQEEVEEATKQATEGTHEEVETLEKEETNIETTEEVPTQTEEETDEVEEVEQTEPEHNFEKMYNELQVEYGKVVTELDEIKKEFTRLQKFEQEILAEKRSVEEEKIFAKFSMLESTKEFEELKVKASQFSLEELEDMCFNIVGRLAFSEKSRTKANKSVGAKLSLNVEKQDVKPIYYGGILG